MTISSNDKWRMLRGTIAGTGFFLLFQYASALWRLNQSTGGMDNKFSQLAREEYLSFLIGQNLLVIPAYLVLWLFAVLLLLPVVTVWWRKCPYRGWGAAALPGFFMALMTHGYFMFRLVHKRPYFLGDAEFGHWYYGILKLPPVSWQPWINGALFWGLPIIALSAAVLWWGRRMSRRWRWIAIGLAFFLIGGGMIVASGTASRTLKQPVMTSKQPPNIIIIGSDSLRGDRLGYTGYTPERRDGAAAVGVSPQIDAWARSAVRFDKCYTPIASTLESAVSVMSASYPHTHGIRHMYPRREQVTATEARIRPIGSILAERGYDTAAIGDWCASYYEMMPLGFQDVSVSSFDSFRIYMSQAVIMAHFVVPLYFDNPLGYRMFPQISSFAQFVTPEVVTRRVEDKLAAQAATGRPFFWHIFYSCNHLPYASADPYYRMFTDPAYVGKNRTRVDFDINEFVSGTRLEDKMKVLPEAEIRQIRGLYDGCTRQFDDCFGRILEALKRHGLDGNTIIVVTADHGDDLYEPGVTLTHGLGFNGGDHCSHIPLAISMPGQSGRDISAQVRSIDIAPTLLRLVGAEPPSEWTGQSLAGWMSGEERPQDRAYYGETSFPFILFRVPGVERPAIPPMDELTAIDPDYNHQFILKKEWEEPVVMAKQRCLRTAHWKVVATPRKAGGRHYGLFHLTSDPDCRDDLAAARPEVLVPMRAALERWIDALIETRIPEIFPSGEP
jgi:arylsulfatase A-like enzyme